MSEGFLSRWSRLKKRTGDQPSEEPKNDAEDHSSNKPEGSTNGGVMQSDPNPFIPGAANQAPGKFMPWAGTNPAYQKKPVESDVAQNDSSLSDPATNHPATNHPATNHPATSHPADPEAALPEIANLNMDSDFKPFMKANVPAEARNAALKKLFADPSFNVMDGLDTYVADYSQPDPIPPEMLKNLLKSEAFCLFDDPVEEEATQVTSEAGLVSLVDEATETPETAEGAQAGLAKPLDDVQTEPMIVAEAPMLPVEAPWPRVAPTPEHSNEKQKGETGG
jgi:Protein of unknown function (DUF3306)